MQILSSSAIVIIAASILLVLSSCINTTTNNHIIQIRSEVRQNEFSVCDAVVYENITYSFMKGGVNEVTRVIHDKYLSQTNQLASESIRVVSVTSNNIHILSHFVEWNADSEASTIRVKFTKITTPMNVTIHLRYVVDGLFHSYNGTNTFQYGYQFESSVQRLSIMYRLLQYNPAITIDELQVYPEDIVRWNRTQTTEIRMKQLNIPAKHLVEPKLSIPLRIKGCEVAPKQPRVPRVPRTTIILASSIIIPVMVGFTVCIVAAILTHLALRSYFSKEEQRLTDIE
jgi:hypothetical protein